MDPTILQAALKLSKAERILLVEQLWDSLVDAGDAPDLSDEQRAELDRRLAVLEQNGPTGMTWEEAKARIIKTPA